MLRHSHLAGATLVVVFLLSLASLVRAQSPPVADTYATSASPTQNFGHSQSLAVGNQTNTYLRFNVSNIPLTATVTNAVLRLYVDGFLTPGQFDVYEIDTPWNEFLLNWNNAPPLGASATGGHPVSIALPSYTTFILVDITSLVQNWVNGTVVNNGIALVLTTTTGSFSVESKENTATSHEPELDIELAGVQGQQGPAGPQGPAGEQGAQGPQGNQGPAGSNGTNGTGFTFRSAFDNGTAYAAYDVVTFNGSTYDATVAIPAGGGNPDSNPAWSLMAQVGAPGQTGATGPQGTEGPPGQTGAAGPQGSQGPQGLPGDMNPGSPYYIQNGTATQSSASFNVDGSGTVGGTLTGTASVSTNGTYKIGGQTILQNPTPTSLFVGPVAGQSNTGVANTFVGTAAGFLGATGGQNTFLGYQSGGLTIGGNNTFVGQSAGLNTTSGSFNTYVGTQAGCANCAGLGSSNIYIGPGTGSFGMDENSTIRIGNPNGVVSQNTTYIAGIYGSFSPSGVPVFVNANGQLGTGSSSGLVSSFNGRAGAVLPATNDYTFPMIGGTLSPTQVPAGSTNYIQNGTAQQPGSNFNISGDGSASGTLSGTFVNVANSYRASGVDVLVFGGNFSNSLALGYRPGSDGLFGENNTYIGAGAGTFCGSCLRNTVLGSGAGSNLGGYDNIIVGAFAGSNVVHATGNIYIGNYGVSSENHTMRLGSDNVSDNNWIFDTYVAGVYNGDPDGGAKVVCISGSGKLWGVANASDCSFSSRRFKQEIADMGDSSSKLFQLRPVTFFYKPEYDTGSHLLQYGLIAEEVAQLYPEMVSYDKSGQPYAVKYQLLAPMLLNEFQKEHAVVASQQETIKTQQQQIETLQQQNAEFQERLSRLESLLSRSMQVRAAN